MHQAASVARRHRGPGPRWSSTRTAAAVVVGLAALLGPGCAKSRPVVVAEGPALALPMPPPRVIVPAEEPIAAAPVPPEVPAAVTPPRATARPPVRRPAAASTEAEAKPEAPPAVVEVPSPPPSEPRELRAAPAAGDASAERRVRDLLNQAARDLGRTDYRRLSTEARAQYDQSKRFSDQAEQALRERNFVFAQTLADKAAVLAAALIGG